MVVVFIYETTGKGYIVHHIANKDGNHIKAFFLVTVGLIVLSVGVHFFYTNSISSSTSVSDCGFFATCEEGHFKEKVRVSHFDGLSGASVISVIGTLLIFLFLYAIFSVRDGLIRLEDHKNILIIWLILFSLIIFVISLVGSSLNGRREVIGSLTEDEYMCQLQVVKSLDGIVEAPQSCPTSPMAEAYWRLDDLDGGEGR